MFFPSLSSSFSHVRIHIKKCPIKFSNTGGSAVTSHVCTPEICIACSIYGCCQAAIDASVDAFILKKMYFIGYVLYIDGFKS